MADDAKGHGGIGGDFDCLSEPPTSLKIVVTLRAVGSAPILTQMQFLVGSDKKVSLIIHNIRKLLRIKPADPLFVFVNGCFAPAPDESVYDLYRNFGDNGKLVIQYALTQAWG